LKVSATAIKTKRDVTNTPTSVTERNFICIEAVFIVIKSRLRHSPDFTFPPQREVWISGFI
jgi:hypothetical protein